MIRQLESEDSLLIVDDVHDTGLSIQQIISDLKTACKKNTPEIKVATPYFKPSKNKTDRKPDFYLHETDEWLVFPHELDGLTIDEIKENKPAVKDLIEKMAMAVISVAVSLSSITSRLGSYSKQKTKVVRKAMVLAV